MNLYLVKVHGHQDLEFLVSLVFKTNGLPVKSTGEAIQVAEQFIRGEYRVPVNVTLTGRSMAVRSITPGAHESVTATKVVGSALRVKGKEVKVEIGSTGIFI